MGDTRAATESCSTFDARPWRLLMLRRAWDAALRRLLLEPGTFAVGHLRRNTTHSTRELLLESLDVTHDRPSGQTRLPLDDWCVITVASDAERELTVMVSELQPRPSQVLAVVRLSRDRRGAWLGAVVRNGQFMPLTELQIIGPRMLRLTTESGSVSLAAGEESSAGHSRTIGAIGAGVHRRLSESTVTLIGAGRNGSLLAWQLASLGVEHVRLIDPDVLQEHNLSAMPGLRARDVGRPKVSALAGRLQQFRPGMRLTLVEKPVTDRTVTRLLCERSDLLVTSVDNDTPRIAASLSARETLTVHLDIGSSVQRADGDELPITGDARLLLPGAGCVACVGGLANPDETLYDLTAPPGSLRRRLRPGWNEERAGSLVTINSITVGAAVQMWLDLLAGRLRTSFWQRFAWDAGRGLQSNAAPVGPADDCRFCHRR